MSTPTEEPPAAAPSAPAIGTATVKSETDGAGAGSAADSASPSSPGPSAAVAAAGSAFPPPSPTASSGPPRDLGRVGGFRVWSAHGRHCRVLFVGRGPVRPEGRGGKQDRPAGEILAAVTPGRPTPAVAGLKQVHSAEVLEAGSKGVCGEGDALVTRRPELAVSVVTADCVPVLVEAGERVAAIHAGWRGLVAGVIPAALDRLDEGGGEPRSRWSAWIGPAIGACCYEVGEEVAEQVARASTPAAVVPGSNGRPHADLVAAALHQLRNAGVRATWSVRCTRCEDSSLWSFRRQGQGAGRNLAFIWREADDVGGAPEPSAPGA